MSPKWSLTPLLHKWSLTPILLRFVLLGALTLFGFTRIAGASESVEATDLNFGRLLASAKLLKEARPASDNYAIKVFRYLDERACDGDKLCNGFGIVVTFEGDGELPDVVAKSACCFSQLGRLLVREMPNNVEESKAARMRLLVEISGQKKVLDVSVKYHGAIPLIKYSLDGTPVVSKKKHLDM